MKIEVVEFYPDMTMRDPYIGTIHVYLPDYEMDIRGIRVATRQERRGYVYHMPQTSNIGEDQKPVYYPVCHFTNKDKQNEFLKKLHELANAYIDDAIKKNPLPPRRLARPKVANKRFNYKSSIRTA